MDPGGCSCRFNRNHYKQRIYVCDSDNPKSGFDALVDVQGSAEGIIKNGFEECLANVNAPDHH